jgi:hypothetical protein
MDPFEDGIIPYLAHNEERLSPLFPSRLVGNNEGVSEFEVTVSGAALVVFWRFSGDANQMHRPTPRGGVVQGLAMLAVVNQAVSQWSPGMAVKRLNCKVNNPCLVRIQDAVTLTVKLKMCWGGRGRNRKAVVTVTGPRRVGGKVVRFMSKVITLHVRTNE